MIVGDTLIPSDSVTDSELQEGENILILHESFIRENPSKRNSREASPFVVRTKLGGTLAPESKLSKIAVKVGVAGPSKKGDQLIVLLKAAHRDRKTVVQGECV